ncbi:serine-rich adhesin for platelets isoform X1 [Anopheles funestus]|uniref:serine-rich adhesin for platelets isoform X1 n=2 Tax=Anopheles funestus TaxID=62324 RepID=UPI0020C61281|nr:serine-rich adhesin for platelets isoform X1 [Anopheles funestus]XP_049296669.1 serine-rich adhesin for platelets isoform X1 [Anopheles funestus]XP_049296670.1 serine-rich adhesin for platelets isoform X1 [Anopheles funestus]XP_049296671.1 serine-rich adhesin for platelets isoform X1 [Anopheles funestus]
MSAGLMSCVRENSPPLDNVPAQVQDIPITITTPETAAPTNASDTTKRKRFHPLRNLRRIFRRRTVSSADRAPGQLGAKGPTHIHFATPGCSTTDATLPRTGFGVPITIRNESVSSTAPGTSQAGTGAYFKRETYRLRNSDDLDKEMSDYQRSLSEGRLVDSDISRDGLSQSHDSVFSESAGTASSLSITLKNELADVLRKRRKDRQGEVSDEDLGLPMSPITPQRKDRGMNKSEGSLSILSMTSSDMDDDRSASNASGHNLLHLDSSTSGSISMNRSDNMDESGDSSKLSHSAAKHKLAVRPKKKGPTRARTRPRESTLLPATPEVNEESLKLSSTNIASNFSPAKEASEKAHSLPYGIMPPSTSTPLSSHPMPRSPSKEISTSKLSVGDAPTSSSIYVNRNISKSHEFERTSEHHLTVEGTGTVTSRKEDDGFFKRILNYSFKKKKHESGKEEPPSVTASPRKEDNTSSVYISSGDPAITDCMPTEQIMKLSLVVGEPELGELSGYKKIKSGPAARQRVFPKDIFSAEEREANAREQQQQHTQRYSSNVEVNRQSVASSGSGHSLTIGEGKVPLHKSEEYLVSKTRKFSERSVDGGEGDDEESDGRKYVSHGERLKSPKVYGLSSYQQKLAKISISTQPATETSKESPSKRAKSVEKSKSFRTYTDSVSNQLQAGGHQVPSLPNLSASLSVGNFSNNFLETEHKFFSMTENMNTGKQRVFKDYISNADDDADSRLLTSSASLQKFEINDNNLLNPREEYVDHQPKSIVLTTNTLTPPEPTSILNKSNQNISQIEENIDKLVSSQFVSIIKSSDEGSSNERLDDISGQVSANVPEFMKIQLNRVEGTGRPAKTSSIVLTTSPTPAPPTSPAIASPTASAGQYQPPEDAIKLQRRFSNENIEITESKPPLPPSVVVRSSMVLEAGIPKSPPAFRKQGSVGGTGDLAGTKRNSMNLSQDLSDDRKVILQRRTSVTEEKIKYERRISSSSEDIKFEKKKSTSEELLEKRGSTGSGNGNSNYNSGSSSGDELVVLRKKFVVGEKEGKDKDGTPELMKVFARRSLKLRSDDDYKVTDSGKPLSSIDSDKENQSSEEKLDKVGLQQSKQSHQQQQQQQLQQPELISTTLVQSVSVTPLQAPVTNGSLKNGCTGTDGTALKNGTNENGQPPTSGEPILRKSVTSKPFGVPNRFTNGTNGGQPRNATSFVEVRKTLLPSATVTVSPVNNNFVKSATTTPAGPEACENQSTVSNNNTINTNRHTIASLNQLNSTNGVGGAINNNAPNATIIETDGGNGEMNEFKGILQRRAEWEKRAKEGFK